MKNLASVVNTGQLDEVDSSIVHELDISLKSRLNLLQPSEKTEENEALLKTEEVVQEGVQEASGSKKSRHSRRKQPQISQLEDKQKQVTVPQDCFLVCQGDNLNQEQLDKLGHRENMKREQAVLEEPSAIDGAVISTSPEKERSESTGASESATERYKSTGSSSKKKKKNQFVPYKQPSEPLPVPSPPKTPEPDIATSASPTKPLGNTFDFSIHGSRPCMGLSSSYTNKIFACYSVGGARTCSHQCFCQDTN